MVDRHRQDRWQGRLALPAKRPMLSAVTATLSGFIFAGDLTGAFDAFDAKDGKVLYSFNVGGRLQSLR